MNIYWLYDIPDWTFAAIVVGICTVFGIAGVLLTRNRVRELHGVEHSHNDIVGHFLAAVMVLYGITLGLVAVGTWGNYSTAQNQVDIEAQLIASLFRDSNTYREPWRSEQKNDLGEYTHSVIEADWPLQRQGIVPSNSDPFLNQFQSHLMSFQPATRSEEIIQAESLRQFNALIEARRARLMATRAGLPGPIWALVILGGVITVTVTWFFNSKSLAVHLWMTGLSSALLGLLIFLIGTLDNPFRGKISVNPEAFSLVYCSLVLPGTPAPSAKPNPCPYS